MKRLLLASLCLLLVTGTARPYKVSTFGGQPVKWPNASATVYHDPATITGGFVSELAQALAAWSNVSGSSFVFTHGGSSPSFNVKDSNNGNTDVYFDSNLPPYGYAVTIVNINSAAISERDVAFNATGITWKSNASGPANAVDFRTVAIHELGHVLGLEHEAVKTSVMNVTGWDPVNARHQLEQDDIDALRYLYPAGGSSTNEFPDLIVQSVSMTPEDAGPGDPVTIDYSLRNVGTAEAKGFRVNAFLTGTARPTTASRYLGYQTLSAALAPISSRSGSIGATLPSSLLPGVYRPGVIADPGRTLGEKDLNNNALASSTGFRVERPALAVAPGARVSGKLGPLGRDLFTMDLPANTVLKLRAKQEHGAATLRFFRDGADVPLRTSKTKSRVKQKLKVIEPGAYLLEFSNSFAGDSDYSLSIHAKTSKTKGVADVTGETRIPFLAFEGSKVTVVVKGLRKFATLASLEGDSAPVKQKTTRAKIGPFVASDTGELTLVLAPGDGAGDGSVRYRITVKPPKKGIPVTR